VLVDELLVVGDEGLGDSLADGVDLRSLTTTRDAHADVEVGELIEANDEERLVDLVGTLVHRLVVAASLPRLGHSWGCEDRSVVSGDDDAVVP